MVKINPLLIVGIIIVGIFLIGSQKDIFPDFSLIPTSLACSGGGVFNPTSNSCDVGVPICEYEALPSVTCPTSFNGFPLIGQSGSSCTYESTDTTVECPSIGIPLISQVGTSCVYESTTTIVECPNTGLNLLSKVGDVCTYESNQIIYNCPLQDGVSAVSGGGSNNNCVYTATDLSFSCPVTSQTLISQEGNTCFFEALTQASCPLEILALDANARIEGGVCVYDVTAEATLACPPNITNGFIEDGVCKYPAPQQSFQLPPIITQPVITPVTVTVDRGTTTTTKGPDNGLLGGIGPETIGLIIAGIGSFFFIRRK